METIREKENAVDESSDSPSTTMNDAKESKPCETEICEDNKANIRIKVSSTDEVAEVSDGH